MTKIHFRPYNINQTVLFPQRIYGDIAEDNLVRMVDVLVESLNLESFRKLYKECGSSPYHRKMMLKVILYAYMNNIYSCRKIEKLFHHDIHHIRLAGYEKTDFITITRFRNRVKKEINEVFTQIVLLFSSKGFISLNVEYMDGTKIEFKANRYTFVWRKTVERNRERLMKKTHVLLGQIDDFIAQEMSFLQSFSDRYDRMVHMVVTDSGYGSEENYRFMSENGMEAYVKYNYFHMEQRSRFELGLFKAENFYYTEAYDFCIFCPIGQKMQKIGTRHVKIASGYVSENARCRVVGCEGCPLRYRCFKAKENRVIELNYRLRKYKQKLKLCSVQRKD